MVETIFGIGDLIENRYRVLSVIGSGGMGTLYRVSDEAEDSEVIALKTVQFDTPEMARHESVERFQREFQLLTQLRHPNLVSVYDYGITGEGELYFTMEWVEGKDLDPKRRSLEPAATIPEVVQVCRALAYLHARGVIHGDLKPQNVLMAEDVGDLGQQVKIVDFGVALETRDSEARARYYTPGYSAPEVKQQRPMDHRADLYSLGALWYALLVGEPPLFMPEPGVERLITLALSEALETQQQVPDAVIPVIVRLLAAQPEKRYSSANEIIEAVNAITGSDYELETRETAESYALRTHFVNREEEIAALQALWEQAKSGEGKLVLISGESGVGKTRLVTELEVQAELEGARVVWGQCVERGGDAYRPWREVLWVLVRYVEGEDEATMQQVGPVLGGLLPQLWGREYMAGLTPPAELEPRAAQLRLNETIVKVMRAAAGLRSTVIVIENVHWADEATLELLRYLERIPGQVGLLLCVTYRDDEIEVDHLLEKLGGEQVERIQVKRLSPEVTTELVRSMLGLEQLPALLTERLQRTTEGNAFFVQEMIRSLAADGEVLRRTVEGWQVAREALREARLPESIRQVVERRLAQLSEEARRVLEWAALVGLVFWEETVAEVGQVTRAQVRAGLGELLEQELVVGRDETSFVGEREYLFLNPTVREMSYESIPPDERRGYHGRVATWLTARSEEDVKEHLGLIAEHLERAGKAEQALVYLRQAGEQAAAQFANAEATSYFSRALNLTPVDDLTEQCVLLLAREKMYDLQGMREAQRQDLMALQELSNALNDDHLRAKLSLRQAYFAEVTGDYPAAIAAAQAAIGLAQAAQDVSNEATGYMRWGWALQRQGEYEGARTQLEQALTLAQAASLGQLEADSLHSLSAVFHRQGKYSEARACCDQALRIYGDLGHRRGESISFNLLGNVFSEQGDYVKAEVYYGQALSIARQIGYRWGEGIVLGNLGEVSRLQGDYAQARAYYEQSLRVKREIDDRSSECMALANLGLLLHNLGDDAAARKHSQQGLRIAQEIGDRRRQGYALTNLGHALAGLELMAEAAESYQRALALRQELGQHHMAMESLAGLARVILAQGDLAQAQSRVDKILEYLEDNTLDGTDEPFWVYLTCYHVLRANQDPRAEGILSASQNLLQERAAKIDDEEMKRSFLENVAAHQEIIEAWENK